MSLLPFKTTENSYIKNQTQVITDYLGNSIELAKYGCVTWQEHEDFSQYTLTSSRDDELSLDVYHTEVVVLFLRSRFTIEKTVPKSEILKLPDGSPTPQTLIDALWIFFKNERERWGNAISKQEDSSKK